MTEAPKRIWPVRGFAPGGYCCICNKCGKRFEGDKRAGECAECALTWLSAEHHRIVADARRAALEEAAMVVGLNAWKHGGEDAYSQGMDAGARHQNKADVDAIQALAEKED